jgi:hypothetical protein
MESKKTAFKLLIKEFHEFEFPEVLRRDLQVPDPEAIPARKVITITGPRRAGKTYFFYQIIRGLEKTVGRIVSCQRSPEPVFLKWKGNEEKAAGDFYVRSGPGSVKLSSESAAEYIRTRFPGASRAAG